MEQFVGIPEMLASTSEATTDQATCKHSKLFLPLVDFHTGPFQLQTHRTITQK